MEANILGMRRYFKMCAYILIGSEYFDMRRYFEMCAYILIGSEYFVCKAEVGVAPMSSARRYSAT